MSIKIPDHAILGEGSLRGGRDDKDKAAPGLMSSSAPGLYLAVLFAIVAIFSKEIGAALSRPVMDDLGAFATTSMRIAWSALILVIIVRPRIFAYNRVQWIAALSLGATIGLMMFAAYAAIARIPLGLVVAIDFLGPLGVATFGFMRSWRLVWPAIALIGVLLLVRDNQGWSADPVGLGLAVAAGFLWALFIVLMKSVGKVFQGLEGLAISFFTAALITLPIGLAQSGFPPSADLLIKSSGLAILTPLLPTALEIMALRRLPAATFGTLASMEPAVAALSGLFILMQALSAQQSLGVAFVVIASLGAVLYATSKSTEGSDQDKKPKFTEDMT